MSLSIPDSAVQLKDGHAITTSLDVAKVFNRHHKNVMQAINRLDCSASFRRLTFQPSSYLNQQGKSQPYYEIQKDGWIMLVMGFKGRRAAQFKEAYIAAFNEAMSSLAELRGESLPALQQQNQQLAIENQRLKQAYFKSDKTLREVQRYLQMGLNYTETGRLLGVGRGKVARIAKQLIEFELVCVDDLKCLPPTNDVRQQSLL